MLFVVALVNRSPSSVGLTSEIALGAQPCPADELSKCIIGDLVTAHHVHSFGGSLDRALAITSCKRKAI